jgi:hypothetical protein
MREDGIVVQLRDPLRVEAKSWRVYALLIP